MNHLRLTLALLACVLTGRSASADEPAKVSPTTSALGGRKFLSPDARRFLAPSSFTYWAGTERILDGELSPAAPRPFDGRGLLPALDDHLATVAYARAAHSAVRHGSADWNVLEIASLHDLRGGAVLGTNFRVDARERTAIGAIATLSVPMPMRLWLVPTVGIGAKSDTAPGFSAGTELRSDRTKPVGYTLGVEASRWTHDRTRALAKVGIVYRVASAATLEQRIGLGGWDGSQLGGDVAVYWTSAALQTLGDRIALYERVTLAQGAGPSVDGKAPDGRALSLDVAVAFRHALGASYGFALQGELGGQPGFYQRSGLELTLYGTLF